MKTKTGWWAIFFCFGMALTALACGGASQSAQKQSPVGLTDAPVALAANLIFSEFGRELDPWQSLAVDDAYVYYWANPAKNKNEILKVRKEGGEPVRVVASDAFISHFCIDDKDIYWISADSSSHTDNSSMKSQILKSSKNGGAPTTLATIEGKPRGRLLVDATSIYYSVFVSPDEDNFMKVSKKGGKPETIAAKLASWFGTGLDDKRIYWTNSNDGTLNWVEKSGGERQSVPVKDPGQIFIDEKSMYVVSRDGLLQLDKNGAVIANLWPDVKVWTRLVADEEYIYFNQTRSVPGIDDAEKNYLLRVSKKEGIVTPMMKGEDFHDLAIDGSRLYWTDYDKKVLMKAGKARLPAPNVADQFFALVSITADEQIYLGGNKVPATDIVERLKAQLKSKPANEQVVYIRGAESVKYGALVKLLKEARDAGIKSIRLIIGKEDGSPNSGMLTVEVLTEKSASLEPPDDTITKDLLLVELKNAAENAVMLNNKPMSLAQLQSHLKNILDYRPDKVVAVKASKSKSYGDVIKVLRTLHTAWAERIILQMDYLDE